MNTYQLDDTLQAPKVQVSVTNLFSRATEILKQDPGYLIGLGLLLMIINGAASRIPYLGNIANILISPTLMAGYITFIYKVHKEDYNRDINDFFAFFQNGKLGDLALYGFLQSLLWIVALLPFFIVLIIGVLGKIMHWGFTLDNFDELDQLANLSSSLLIITSAVVLITFLLAIYGYSITFFGLYLIVFKNLSPVDAIKYSIKFGHKYLGTLILFGFLALLLNLGGFLLCGLGLLVTAPLTVIASNVLFNQVIGYDDEQDQFDLSKHLVN